MTFRPALAAMVAAGEKTVTRRLTSTNPRSPWFDGGCSLVVGRDYAVCPGRGKNAICRVLVTSVTVQELGYLTDDEARREGFANAFEFEDAWKAINGSYDRHTKVWRIEFERVQVLAHA